MIALLRTHRWLVVIVALFVVVAGTFSVMTPLHEGSDEPSHLEYVLFLARGKGLPMLENRRAVGDETFQPPLYYAVVAPLVALAGAGSGKLPIDLNPHVSYDVGAWTNENKFVHTRLEAFPYQGVVWGAHLARLAGVCFGAGVVMLTYALARELFPRWRALAPGAAALTAFVPQFAFTSGLVTNDIAAVFLNMLGLWYLARIARRLPQLTLRQAGLLGLLLGAAPLGKESGLALAPAAALVVALGAWRFRAWGLLARAAIVVPIVALVLGWWYVVRYSIYGFWLGNPASSRAIETMTLEGFLQQWTEIEISFWGLFGWTNVPLPQPAYDALHLFALAALGGIGVGLLRRRWTRAELLALLALGVWCLLILSAYVRWLSATFQAHGRLLFPALPAFMILAAAGIQQWLPRRWARGLLAAACAGLCLLSFWSALVLIPQAYPSPRFVSESDWRRLPLLPSADLSGQIELLAAEVRTGARAGTATVDVTAVWRARREPDADYTVTVQVFAPDETRIGHLDTFPVSGLYPTSDWRAGDTLMERYQVAIAPGARPLRATVVIGMYNHETGRALPVLQANGSRVGRVMLGEVELR